MKKKTVKKNPSKIEAVKKVEAVKKAVVTPPVVENEISGTLEEEPLVDPSKTIHLSSVGAYTESTHYYIDGVGDIVRNKELEIENDISVAVYGIKMIYANSLDSLQGLMIKLKKEFPEVKRIAGTPSFSLKRFKAIEKLW